MCIHVHTHIRLLSNGYEVSFWSDEKILKLIVVTVVKVCEYTKNDWIVKPKCVSCMPYEYLNKCFFQTSS